MNRFFRSALFPLIVIVLLVYLASSQLNRKDKNEKKVTYSEFITEVKADRVDTAVFNPNKLQVNFQLENGDKGSVHYPSNESAPPLTVVPACPAPMARYRRAVFIEYSSRR